MASLGQAKSLGGVGAILVLIGTFLGAPGAVLAIIGFILVLVAVKYVADIFSNQTMFHTNGLLYLIGAATFILGVRILIIIVAEILQIVAFFSIPEQMAMGPQPMPGQMGTPPPSGTM